MRGAHKTGRRHFARPLSTSLSWPWRDHHAARRGRRGAFLEKAARPDHDRPDRTAPPGGAGRPVAPGHHGHGPDRRHRRRPLFGAAARLSRHGLGPQFGADHHVDRSSGRGAGDDRPGDRGGKASRDRRGAAPRPRLRRLDRRRRRGRAGGVRSAVPARPGPEGRPGRRRGRAADRVLAVTAGLCPVGGLELLAGGAGAAGLRDHRHVGRQRGEPGGQPAAGAGDPGAAGPRRRRGGVVDLRGSDLPDGGPGPLHRPHEGRPSPGRLRQAGSRPRRRGRAAQDRLWRRGIELLRGGGLRRHEPGGRLDPRPGRSC